MFEYVKGTLVHATPLKAVVDVSGVGYALRIPLSVYSRLPQVGSPICLYTSHVVREDAEHLYAFLTIEDRDLFEKLTDISGVGPKTALALLGHLELSDLHVALADGDIPLLSKVPGIGKKTAERLVIEMRGKVKDLNLAPTTSNPSERGLHADALSALINLGYNPLHARKALQTVAKPELKLPELITAALRQL
jgi:Holliday junction DNA helicase RuvA